MHFALGSGVCHAEAPERFLLWLADPRSFCCNFVSAVLEGTFGLCVSACVRVPAGGGEGGGVCRKSPEGRQPWYVPRLGGRRRSRRRRLHVEPVVPHAGAVPLAAAGPAPLQPALRLRTRHVHAASIFLNGHMAARAGLGGFLDCFFGGLFPPGLLRGLLVNSVSLRNCS